LDAFHVVRLVLTALDQVRRRVQQDTTGHRGRKDDPLFRIRRLLRRGYEHHTPKSWNRMIAGIEAGDSDAQVQRAWIAVQELRLLYRETSRAGAERRLLRWFTDIAEHEIPELLRLARTLDAWRDELLTYFDTDGVSNGPTEAINGLIKKIKRVSVNRPSPGTRRGGLGSHQGARSGLTLVSGRAERRTPWSFGLSAARRATGWSATASTWSWSTGSWLTWSAGTSPQRHVGPTPTTC
jgi:hypothetical protein